MNEALLRLSREALPAAAPNSNGGSGNVSEANSVRMSTAIEKLRESAQCNHPANNTIFINLCISLSRTIDFSIAINEIPAPRSKLPTVCKLVCQRRRDCNLQAAIMVLMVTMKPACKAQWFSAEESRELLALAEEVARIFNTHEGVSSEQTNINPTISQIMSRYYPRIKLVHVLASVDIKPGFEACAVDFSLTKNMSNSEGRIRLLVAMKDNMDTSLCIITPQKVNFMLNGRAVLGRMVGQTHELGPQLPTNISHMLKYGTNLLQAVGHFDAHYIVLIAFMSDVPSSFLPVPEDYAQPASATVESVLWQAILYLFRPSGYNKNPSYTNNLLHTKRWVGYVEALKAALVNPYNNNNNNNDIYPGGSRYKRDLGGRDVHTLAPSESREDAEVVEGPSRISLNCPISFTRIKKPAKGKLCKHLKCFDLSNYVEMNTQCPLWKCPHCNQPISYPDIRIDQKISMILQEVAESVVSVIIHSDGSWEAVSGNDDHNKDELNARPTEVLQEGSDQPLASEFPNEPSNVYDLTQGDDDNMVIIEDDMPEDTKPVLQSVLLNTSTYMGQFAPSAAGNPSELNRNSATQIQGFSCPGPLEIFSGQADYSTRSNNQPVGGASHFTPSPVLTDSVTPAVMQRQQAYMGANQQSSPLTRVPSATNAMQLQQAPLQQMESVYGGHRLPRNVIRVPNAMQALPAQRPRSSSMVSTRPALNNSSGISSAMNNLLGNTSAMNSLSRITLPPPILNSASATRRDAVQRQHIINSQQHSTSQMRSHTSPGQVPNNNTFRPNSSSQVTNQPRSSTLVQVPNNSTFIPNSSSQVTNQPRSTTPVQTPNSTFRSSTSPQIASQPQSTTPVQVPNNNTLEHDSSPQIANQPRPTISVQIPNDNLVPNSSPQIANQSRPTSQILPQMISTPPHLRARTQVPPGGSINAQQYRPIPSPASVTSAQQSAVSRTRQLPTTPIQIQTSRAHPSSVPSVTPPGRPVQTVSRTQDLVDVQSSEQNWQPSGRMRGSLAEKAFSENYSQFVIRPTQQAVPNPPGPSPNQVNNMASELQALIGNRNLHGSSSSQPNPSQNNNS